jgi:Tfp pilus assembly protein PilF
LADLDSAIALDSEAVDIYMERAALHLRIGNAANAAADLEQVLAMSKNEEQVQVARQMLALIR